MGDESDDRVSDPLHGSPPPTPTSAQVPPTPPAGGQPKQPEEITTDPLYGATPSPATSAPAQVSGPFSAPTVPRRTARLPLSHPSPLPSYLRRLGYVLSLVLGSSAIIAGIWSVFILPLLHSSFSARKALVEQQKDRWVTLVTGLKRIKEGRLYDTKSNPDTDLAAEVETRSEAQSEDEEARLTLTNHTDTPASKTEMESLIPLSPISSLSTSLGDLVSALTSTSTTRTSLLSTLESYTSSLHRQVYIRSQPLASQRYGLGTLSANLARAGGGQSKTWPYDDTANRDDTDDDLANMGVKSEEWDAVRKEVRTIKGMLLSRRNFVQVDQSGR